MAKRRHAKNEELMLIPFLDILCSLIGVLVLIIVVLCVAQSQRARGRSQEDLDRSKQYIDAVKKAKEVSQFKNVVQEDVKKLEELKKEVEAKKKRVAMLRKLLASTTETGDMNKEFAENLTKELDDLLVESGGIDTEQKKLQEEIAKLMAEMKARQVPTTKPVPAVIVQPGGSGLAEGGVYFVETTGGKLTIYWDAKQKTVLSASPDVVGTDTSFQYFLKQVAASPKAKIIFLVRDDGMGGFNNAAGWAQQTYGLRTDQVGRLPIPGRGEIDLQMFNKFLGTMAPPPEAKVIQVGAPAAAPAAGAPAPAAGTPPAAPPAPATPPATPPAKPPGT